MVRERSRAGGSGEQPGRSGPVEPLHVNYDEVLKCGYAVVPGAIAEAQLAEFHACMRELGTTLSVRHGVTVRNVDPLIDLLLRGGRYRAQLFALLKNLHVVQRMSHDLADRLRAGGLWNQMGMQVPLAWPTLRADLPHEDTYLLPMHQDYGSTRCHTALRGWAPLTPASEERGTLRLVAGSHRLGILDHDTTDPLRPQIPRDRYKHLPQETITCDPGTLVLLHPAVVHESVPNRSQYVKFVLLLQLQDLATMVDPDDDDDALHTWVEALERRERARAIRSTERAR